MARVQTQLLFDEVDRTRARVLAAIRGGPVAEVLRACVLAHLPTMELQHNGALCEFARAADALGMTQDQLAVTLIDAKGLDVADLFDADGNPRRSMDEVRAAAVLRAGDVDAALAAARAASVQGDAAA